MSKPGNPQFSLRHTVGQHISQPDDPTKRAQVATQGTSDDYGLVVRDPRLDDVVVCLNAVVDELREIKFQLNLITEFEA